MKKITFESEDKFYDWVEQGNELYAIYTHNGDYICDVEEPMFIHLLDASLIDGESRCLTENLCEEFVAAIADYVGTKVVIEKKKGLSFRIKRDNNAHLSRCVILSVIKDGTCVEAPRFRYLCDALGQIESYIDEFGDEGEQIGITITR